MAEKKPNWDLIKYENQLRKDKSIAYFNSLNAAINLLTSERERETIIMGKDIIKWRDFFFKEWSKWWHNEYPKPLSYKQTADKSQAEETLSEADRQQKIDKHLDIINQ